MVSNLQSFLQQATLTCEFMTWKRLKNLSDRYIVKKKNNNNPKESQNFPLRKSFTRTFKNTISASNAERMRIVIQCT